MCPTPWIKIKKYFHEKHPTKYIEDQLEQSSLMWRHEDLLERLSVAEKSAQKYKYTTETRTLLQFR